jgi:hypothetical protein
MHINTTFEKITDGIKDVLDDRDYEMQSPGRLSELLL